MVLFIFAATGLKAGPNPAPASAVGLWHESNWRDFADGVFESHIYVSYRDGGTVEFANRFDLNNDGYIDIACPDLGGPNLTVYFGDSSGFSTSRCRRLPISSGGSYDMADINLDGHAELIHAAYHSRLAVIYWGSDSGPSRTDTLLLPTNTAEAITAADLDKDGYIDLLFPGEAPPSLTIYWGSAQGYSVARTTEVYIGSGLGHRTVVADINRDGYLDMTICCINDNTRQPIAYFGPNRTYWIEWLEYRGMHDWCGHGNTLADLDGNGWLDVVLTGYNGITESYIYFGSDSGFSTQHRTIVDPGNSMGGSSAYDFDGDGDVDLIYYRGNGHLGGIWQKPIIYWNSGAPPYFSNANTQEIGPYPVNAYGGTVGDFNRDGYTDVFVEATPNFSMVLWGPDWNTVDTLPCNEGHHGPERDIGNVYDRSFREDYISSVFDAGGTTQWHTISWDDTTPGGSSVTMAVRTGNTPAPDSSWSGWVSLGNGDSIPDSLDSRYIQYRATLSYITPAVLPMLYEVSVDYGQPAALDVGVQTIIAPRGSVDSGATVTPTALIRNYGNQAASFPVTMLIGTSYRQTVQESLPSGASDTVTFPSWVAEPVGTLPVVCFTSLAGDEEAANDTAYDTVVVTRAAVHDVGPSAILAPGPLLYAGDTVQPKVIIRNFGTETERYFDVRFRIGSVYDRIARVDSALVPNGTADLTFPSWIAEPGNFTVSCSTMLANDANRANDRLTLDIGVTSHLVLYIEPDQSDSIQLGERKTYHFYARLEGTAADVVELVPPRVPVGWSAVLFDSTGNDTLYDTDSSGLPDLGRLAPNVTCRFSLRVQAPASLIGDTTGLCSPVIVLHGFAESDTVARDSARLSLWLNPPLAIHNYPNPFADKTTFIIALPEHGFITLAIYDRAGECVCVLRENEAVGAGVQLIGWNGENRRGAAVAPGTYHYVLDYVHSGTTERIRKKLVKTRATE